MVLETFPEKPGLFYFDESHTSIQQDNVYGFNDYLEQEFSDLEFIVCLGYKHLQTKMHIIRSLIQKERKLASLVHPTSYVSKSASLGPGTVIYPMCTVDQGVVIENGVLLNNSVTVSHDSTIGECSFLSPGVTLSGNTRIGKCCFLGTGSSVANNLSIEDNCIIGIGSCITDNIPANSSVIGNPARKLSRKINLQ